MKSETTKIAKKVTKVYDKLQSIDLKVILDAFKKEKISVIADELRGELCTYNKELKVVVIDEEFIWEDRVDDQLAYLLLHQYYNVLEGSAESIYQSDYFRGYADIYARFVFQMNNKHTPDRFMARSLEGR